MRPQSKITISLKDKILGGPVPLICLPLVATDKVSLLEQAIRILPCMPDVVEWRVDKFHAVRDEEAVLDSLKDLRKTIGGIPLVFTCRDISEGGFQEIEQADRLRLNLSVIASGMADLVDVEIANGKAMIGEIKKASLLTGTMLILSYHNFNETPDEKVILERLSAARDLGGDVAKVAVMPKNYKDVLTLLGATYRARTECLDIPMITISMGVEGVVSRIVGGLFGSDLTFAVGDAASAPGQIPIDDLRDAWKALPH